MRRRDRGGFTLLEMLVVLVVLSLLIVGLGEGLRFGVAALHRQAVMTDRAADMAAADATLREIFEQIDPGSAHDAPRIEGTRRHVALTTGLPEGAAAMIGARTGNVDILVDREHRLVLRLLPYHHAVPLGAPPAPVDIVLLDRIDHVDIAFWPRVGPQAWRGQWSGTDIPALIRIAIVPRDGAGPAWAAIVAAPARARP